MNPVQHIGFLALPWPLLLAAGAAALGLAVGMLLDRRQAAGFWAVAWRVLLATLLAARLAFVFEYRDTYLQAPLDILDIRDGGWNGQIGVIVGWLYALALARKQPSLHKPLMAGMVSGTAAWMLGSAALLLNTGNDTRLSTATAQALDGTQVELRSFSDRPTVVNLWASWCPPCRHEMPLLQRAQVEYPQVHFVFLNQGEPAGDVQRFLDSQQLELRHVLLDPKGRASASLGGQTGLPTTLFFDARGHLAARYVGELSHDTLERLLGRIGVHQAPAAAR
ncbi:TlpA family protein disulfide reductase [Thauera sp. Sel9]|uniref:TlpA family protein disulfide reductase n=1 Tax=Thauera sp. Sel9 TaxID=2974299 RepID=UPI0021E13953|nr:TlpA disulfide reductase family protein [Thauera sp. Sel9]MCV2217274.1 TlpA family protein disulfide reductase [Thauera sp. Sel9]